MTGRLFNRTAPIVGAIAAVGVLVLLVGLLPSKSGDSTASRGGGSAWLAAEAELEVFAQQLITPGANGNGTATCQPTTNVTADQSTGVITFTGSNNSNATSSSNGNGNGGILDGNTQGSNGSGNVTLVIALAGIAEFANAVVPVPQHTLRPIPQSSFASGNNGSSGSSNNTSTGGAEQQQQQGNQSNGTSTEYQGLNAWAWWINAAIQDPATTTTFATLQLVAYQLQQAGAVQVGNDTFPVSCGDLVVETTIPQYLPCDPATCPGTPSASDTVEVLFTLQAPSTAGAPSSGLTVSRMDNTTAFFSSGGFLHYFTTSSTQNATAGGGMTNGTTNSTGQGVPLTVSLLPSSDMQQEMRVRFPTPTAPITFAFVAGVEGQREQQQS